jgi:uncharacterized protein (DUF4415 family)
MRYKRDPENPPFDFSRARRITPEEHAMFHKAVEEKLGIKLPPRGRPLKDVTERTTPITIRLHPKVIAWAKSESKRRGIGYQTVINETLLKHAA